MRRPRFTTRAHAIRRVEAHLRSSSFPRLQMMLLVALTGGMGLLASYTMLRAGLDSMALRYPLALAVAYLFFLGLLWLWLHTKADHYLDVSDLSGISLPVPTPSSAECNFSNGAGGDFGGGGASGAFDDAQSTGVAEASDGPMKVVGEAAASVGDADELVIPLVVILLAIGLAVASLYVVYIAPVLFAEVLVDGALSYALFRHLRAEDRPMWISSAVRHTWLPFAITAVFLMAVGAAMSAYAPGAKSIGQVMAYAKHHTYSSNETARR
jgi:hypothetical protein